MGTTIDTVFEKGVFRPLHPVAIQENLRVRIRLEDESQDAIVSASYPRLPAGQYSEEHPDFSDSEVQYTSVPPKSVREVQAKVTFAGKLPPAIYLENE
jgi:predicted DNA-binding antitoxin AbrB/MazE fold protein